MPWIRCKSFAQVLSPPLFMAAALVASLISARAGAQLRVHEVAVGTRTADTVAGTFTFSRALHVAYIRKLARGEQVVVNGTADAAFDAIPRARLSEAGRVSAITFSPNGKRVAYVATLNNKSVMVVDGAAGVPFDYIAVGNAYFSPDSRHVTYTAKRGDKNFVVTDSRESAAYDAIDVRHVKFTPDSKHAVYTATVGDQHAVVLDDKEITRAEYVGDPVFSKTGNRLAFVQMNKDAWSVVVDGVAGKSYRSIGNNLLFTDNAQHFVYRARDSLDHIVTDGVESAGFGAIRENSYNVSADGKHVAFVAQDRGRDQWVLDGVPQRAYDWVSGDPTLSPDGNALAYVAELDRKRFVVIGASEGQRFDDITDFPQFTASNHVLYVAKRGAQQFVVVDTVETAYDQITTAFVASSGKVIAVARRGAKWSIVIDGKPGAMYTEAPSVPIFSADGQRLAFEGNRNGQRFVSVDGKESQPFDDVRALSFSPDGRHVAFVATRGSHEFLVLDGVASANYDQVSWLEMSPIDTPNAFAFLARRGSADLRVTVEWNAAAIGR